MGQAISSPAFSKKGAGSALLYAPNLTAKFDLSSREAGAILQKLRDYRIRLAVVCPVVSTSDAPDSPRFICR